VIPKWIVDVLDKELPNLTGGERDRLAEALYEAAFANLKQPIIDAIKVAATNVLESRAVRDRKSDVASEIARNCAGNVLAAMGEA
jgi:hypothetical protein